MAEPLKNLFNPDLIHSMGQHLARIDGFDRAAFEATAVTGLGDLEMMQRSAQIAKALAASLPPDFPAILGPLAERLHPETQNPIDGAPPDDRGLRGWALVPVGTYVATHGLNHPAQSLAFLRQMTQRFSAEFAVRPFFRDHTGLTLEHAAAWVRDPNFHVRRMASEGSRPRLPWGIRLTTFVDDPAPLIALLETLRDDGQEYVRRSVANNLNDIAKDHPDLVAGIAACWLQGSPPPRRKLVSHACRSLIKSGHPETLRVFGYGPPDRLTTRLDATPQTIALGQTLTLTATLSNTGPAPRRVLVDLVMRFLRADGSHGAKVFKWTETGLPPGKPLTLTKRLPLRDVTTRRHYAGQQFAALQVNGQIVAETRFELQLPAQPLP
ncbi:MAG: hypothetical protein GY717_18120 [Rhodobacteraceae bacterium]|nr:hypothetical protein [Paracoccaceae bacterium]